MPYQQQVEQHHRESYAADVEMVAQQLRNPIRDMVTVVPASGEAQSMAELIGEADYNEADDYDRRNPDDRYNLNLRGNSILSALDAPLSENLATVQSPGLVTAGGAIVSGLSEPLVEGEVCVVGYEITDFEAGAALTYPANNGSAFDGDNPPVTPG